MAANIAQGAITVVRNAREGKKYSGRIGFQIQNQKPQTGGQDDEAENKSNLYQLWKAGETRKERQKAASKILKGEIKNE